MISENIKKELSKKNFKTYSFFLVFTAFIWFALQFSKNYSKEIDFKIEYTKIDSGKFVLPESDNEVTLTLEGNGFQLLKFYIFNKTLKLDVRKASMKTAQKSFYVGQKMYATIKESLGYHGKIAFSSKDTITVKFSEIITKNIPVIIKSDIKYTIGHTSLKGATTTAKVIPVKGPKFILDSLKFIETEKLSLNNLQESYQGEIGLEIKKLPQQLELNKKSIPVFVKVDKLTEEEFVIPIQIKNVPKGQRVQLFPKEVTVVFGVVLDNYSKLKASDFTIVADLKEISPQSNTLLLRLEKKPELVYNVRMLEKEVQFIVIK